MPGSYKRINEFTVEDPDTGQTYFFLVQASMEQQAGQNYNAEEARAAAQQSRISMADDNETIPIPDGKGGFLPYPGATANAQAGALAEARDPSKLVNPYPNQPAGDLINPYPGKGAKGKKASSGKASGTKTKVSGPQGLGAVPGNANPYDTPPTGPNAVQNAYGMYGEISDDAARIAEQRMNAAGQTGEIDRAEQQALEAEKAKEQQMLSDQARETRQRAELRAQMAGDARAEAENRLNKVNQEIEQAMSTEVDNNRYWNNRSGFQKIAFLIGASAGAWTEHIYGKNRAFEILQQEIVRDISSQEGAIQRKMELLNMKKDNIKEMGLIDRLGLEDFDAESEGIAKEYMIRLQSANAEIEKIKAKYGAERVAPSLLDLQSQIQADYLNTQKGLVDIYHADAVQERERLWQETENAKNRRHQAAMQKREFAHEEVMQANKSASVDASGLISGGEQNGLFTVQVDQNGNEVFVPVAKAATKERGDKMIEITSAANKEFSNLNLVKELLKDKSVRGVVMGNTKLDAAMATAVMEEALAKSGKAVSDTERDYIKTALMGVNSQWKAGAAVGDIEDALNQKISQIEARTNMELNTYKDATSGQIRYKPVNLYAAPGNSNDATSGDAVAQVAGELGTDVEAPQQGIEPEAPATVNKREDYYNLVDRLAADGDIRELKKVAEALEKSKKSSKGDANARNAVEQKILNPKTGKYDLTYKDVAAYAKKKIEEVESGKYKQELYKAKKLEEEKKNGRYGGISGRRGTL